MLQHDAVAFGRELGALLPVAAARMALAWAATFVVLVFMLQMVKRHMRARVLHADDRIRAWALSLRYKGAEAVSPAQAAALPAVEEEVAADVTAPPPGHERVALTWFMRFWTNFASAPSLSFWSLAVPFAFFARGMAAYGMKSPAEVFRSIHLWLLPGLCFCGSMLLSNVLKRVFKRVRPPRPAGSFGHSMKDASFPSGHSLTSLCFWLTMTLSVALAGWGAGVAIAFGLCAVAIVLLTGLSRIYMGVHFPSDVVGGYFIGAVWSLASYGVLSALL